MILITYGTRPEYLKIKPLIEKLREDGTIDFKILFTGQHQDIAPQDFADYVFNMNHVISNNRLDSIIGNIMKESDNFFFLSEENITHILVQGDTTSCLALALSAFHRKIKVIHLEAGLRTWDKENPYPEEINRRIISEIADIHLCPTIDNFFNLPKHCEIGIDSFVVGNTVLDNLNDWKEECEYGDEILVTLHRRENHENINKWFNAINDLAIKHKELTFVLPLHPNPNVMKHKDILTNVKVVNPLDHSDLLSILVKSKLVITDSGGIQEECSFFNKKCLVCRKVTERPEALKSSSFLVENPDDLNDMFETHINNYMINIVSPFGDGYASEKIVKILKEKI